jgi:hypothetical protein
VTFLLQLIGGMSTSELSQIARETNDASIHRSKLVDEIINLKAGE